MERIFLSPEEQYSLDPTGACRASFRRAFSPITDDENWLPHSALLQGSVDDFYEHIQAFWKTLSDVHQPYVKWCEHYKEKVGPQGGSSNIYWMLENVSLYYDRVSHPSIPEPLILGLNYLVSRITSITSRVGIAQLPCQTRYHTFAGVPSGGQKGYFSSESLVPLVLSDFCHLLPAVPGFRRLKNKKRLIFQDALQNVRLVERQLSGCRHWLRTYLPEYFSSWLNPACGTSYIATTMALSGEYVIAWDYKQMDTHFSKHVAEKVVLPVLKLLLAPADQLILEFYNSEAFDTELFCGDFKLSGTHNLFSGQPPTNDYETIFSVILPLGAAISVGISPQRLRILANGDDLTLSIVKGSLQETEKLLEAMIEISMSAGMVVNREKLELQKNQVTFCKKMYYRQGKSYVDFSGRSVLQGAYPSVLAFNSIYYPEHYARTSGLAAVSDLQRLDNCSGSIDFTSLVQFVGSHRKKHDWSFTPEEAASFSAKDWWQRLYGEPFDPLSSAAYRVLLNNHLED